MKKKRPCFLIILFSICALSYSIHTNIDTKATPSIIIVPDDFPTIQGAINAAVEGATISVKAGTYYENIVVNRTVSLTGEDSRTTIVDGGGIGHVVIITGDDVNMTGFTVRNSGTAYHITGINLNNANHCNISGNIITNNEHGLEIHNSSYYNVVSGNNITQNNKWGMHIISSHNNSISRNTIGGSIWGSIAIHGLSTHNRIFKNNMENNENVGISIDDSDHNYVYENNMTDNQWGISVQYGAEYNTISRNNIANNSYGVKLESNTYANMFFHNNLANNTFQTSIVGYNYANSWDAGYPYGGNFWSDYNGTDRDYDSIGDTPYVVDADNRDNYPLMGMFSSFDTSFGYAIDFVSNSSISEVTFDLSYGKANPPEAMLVFNVSGETGTEGFLRVCIPKILINASYVAMFDNETLTNATWPRVRELPCSDQTHGYLYINFTHSEHTIMITGMTMIPEFHPLLSIPLFMLATLLVIIVYRRKERSTLLCA